MRPKGRVDETTETNKKVVKKQLERVFTYKSPNGYGDVKGFEDYTILEEPSLLTVTQESVQAEEWEDLTAED